MITGEDVVLKLKRLRVSMSAKSIAQSMGVAWGIDSRAVATALRKPVKDGRVSCHYRKGLAHYRFVRLKAKS
jgi:hypothetical protein